MSDVGLHGSIYEQLRAYADRLDRCLISLRSAQNEVVAGARRDLAALLRELADEESTNPGARFLALILRHEPTWSNGIGCDACETLAATLEERSPDDSELSTLEKLAGTLDRECATTLLRMKGGA